MVRGSDISIMSGGVRVKCKITTISISILIVDIRQDFKYVYDNNGNWSGVRGGGVFSPKNTTNRLSTSRGDAPCNRL